MLKLSKAKLFRFCYLNISPTSFSSRGYIFGCVYFITTSKFIISYHAANQSIYLDEELRFIVGCAMSPDNAPASSTEDLGLLYRSHLASQLPYRIMHNYYPDRLHQRISTRSRLLAILFYLNSSICAASFIAIGFLPPIVRESLSPQPQLSSEFDPTILKVGYIEIATRDDLHHLVLLLYLIIFINLSVISIGEWLIDRERQSFVDLSSKTAANFCSNIAIMVVISLFICIFHFVMLLLPEFGELRNILISAVEISRTLLFNLMATSYLLNSAVGAVHAFKGQYFKSFLIDSFIKPV